MTHARDLAALREQIRQARAMLAELHKAATTTPSCKAQRRANDLLAVNEQLVIAALKSRSDADTATRALDIMSRSAEVDALTDLPNRGALLDRLNYTIAIAKRNGTKLALLFVDLNDFKQINDTLGHTVGDQVIRLAAKRLASTVRVSDTVSRHGGDEFLILLTEITQADDVVHIAKELITALRRPARVGERLLELAASIGISLFPSDGGSSDVLIERADAAMYRAKRRGNGSYAFHGETDENDVSAAYLGTRTYGLQMTRHLDANTLTDKPSEVAESY